MTAEEPPPSTEEDLQAELKKLLQRADANGVDVVGGWECRNSSNHPDWDIVVTEVKKKVESE